MQYGSEDEMIGFHSSSASASASAAAYTSLKDILSSSSSSNGNGNAAAFKDRWQVKDPLLQRAVWAYLQPCTQQLPQQLHRSASFFHKLRDSCFRFFACFNHLLILLLNGLLPPHLHL